MSYRVLLTFFELVAAGINNRFSTYCNIAYCYYVQQVTTSANASAKRRCANKIATSSAESDTALVFLMYVSMLVLVNAL
jgi:hypothetical protein